MQRLQADITAIALASLGASTAALTLTPAFVRGSLNYSVAVPYVTASLAVTLTFTGSVQRIPRASAAEVANDDDTEEDDDS